MICTRIITWCHKVCLADREPNINRPPQGARLWPMIHGSSMWCWHISVHLPAQFSLSLPDGHVKRSSQMCLRSGLRHILMQSYLSGWFDKKGVKNKQLLSGHLVHVSPSNPFISITYWHLISPSPWGYFELLSLPDVICTFIYMHLSDQMLWLWT